MSKQVLISCAYCGREMPVEALETRNELLVCRDVESCDKADAEREARTIRELAQEEGQLTEAEKEFLR